MKKITMLVLFFNSINLDSSLILHKSLQYQEIPALKSAVIHSSQTQQHAIKSKSLEAFANDYWVSLKDGTSDFFDLITQRTEEYGHKEHGLLSQDIQDIKQSIINFRFFKNIETFGHSKIPEWIEDMYENYQEEFLTFTQGNRYSFLGPENIRKTVANFIIQEWNKIHNKPSEYLFVRKKIFQSGSQEKENLPAAKAVSLEEKKNIKIEELLSKNKKEIDAKLRDSEGFFSYIDDVEQDAEGNLVYKKLDMKLDPNNIEYLILSSHDLKNENKKIKLENILANKSTLKIIIAFDDSVNKIEDSFKVSNSIRQLIITGINITEIGNNFLSYSVRLKNLTLPDRLIKVGNDFLAACKELPDLILPAGLAEVGNYFLYACQGLKVLKLPTGLNKVGNNFLWLCTGLTTLIVPAGVTEVGNDFLCGCQGLKVLTLPAGLNKIGDNFLFNCEELISLTLSAELIEVGDYFLYGCKKLKVLHLPDSLNRFGDRFLSDCSGLVLVTISEDLFEKLGGKSFFKKKYPELLKVLYIKEKKDDPVCCIVQ